MPDHQRCWAPLVHMAPETLTPEVLINAGVPQPRQPSQGLGHPPASAGSAPPDGSNGQARGTPKSSQASGQSKGGG